MTTQRFKGVVRHIYNWVEKADAERIILNAMKVRGRDLTKAEMLEILDAVASDLKVPARACLELRIAFSQDTRGE